MIATLGLIPEAILQASRKYHIGYKSMASACMSEDVVTVSLRHDLHLPDRGDKRNV